MKKILQLISLISFGTLAAQNIGLEPFVSGLDFPIEITHANDERLFIAQKGGAIKIASPEGVVNAQNFLDISPLIPTLSERGLLGLAFHPDYADNGYFYVYYSEAEEGNAVVARYKVSDDDPNIADANSGTILLTVSHGGLVHFGGCIKFGPDGYLYIGIGDGGAPIDAENPAQSLTANLGKILRLDVDAPAPYIPSGNPFATIDGLDEIWATGVRNPWKFSFDKVTGDMWLTDVGYTQFEEINKISMPLEGGKNFGWPCYEALTGIVETACTGTTTDFPLAFYDHNGGCSIIGGYVYRGTEYPNLNGKYFFTDFCTQQIGWLDASNSISFSPPFIDFGFIFLTMGEDVAGELYVGSDSSVYKLVEEELGTDSFVDAGISLSPNPAMDYVILRGDNVGNAIYQVHDLSGKEILSSSLNLETEVIDVSQLHSGLYVVTITKNSGEKYIAKLCKN